MGECPLPETPIPAVTDDPMTFAIRQGGHTRVLWSTQRQTTDADSPGPLESRTPGRPFVSRPKGLGGRNEYPPAGTAGRSGCTRPRALLARGLREVGSVLLEELAKA
eukprot:812396-Alexandrium_andersonii.AAC.3